MSAEKTMDPRLEKLNADLAELIYSAYDARDVLGPDFKEELFKVVEFCAEIQGMLSERAGIQAPSLSREPGRDYLRNRETRTHSESRAMTAASRVVNTDGVDSIMSSNANKQNTETMKLRITGSFLANAACFVSSVLLVGACLNLLIFSLIHDVKTITDPRTAIVLTMAFVAVSYFSIISQKIEAIIDLLFKAQHQHKSDNTQPADKDT